MSAPNFWDDNQAAQKVIQERSEITEWLGKITTPEKKLEDLEIAIELGKEAEDDSMVEEVQNTMKALQEEVNQLEVEVLLSGEDDHRNAIIFIHSGARSSIVIFAIPPSVTASI